MKRLIAGLSALAVAIASLASTARAAAPPRIWTAHVPGIAQSLGRLTTLTGSTTPALRGARYVSPVARTQPLSLAISLRARDRAELDALVRAQYTPGSALYHQWINPVQFANRFAPTSTERARVQDWLRGQGFRVTYMSRNGLTIDVAGTAATAERAFHTAMALYRRGGQRFYANSGLVKLPSDVAARVSSVDGLDDAERIPVADHLRRLPAGHFRRNDYDTPPVAPADLQAEYDLKPFYDNGFDGENQTIAVFQESDFSNNNLAQFDQKYNLPVPSIERIGVDGTPRRTSSQGEAELDLEVIHAIAPAAHILMYEANPTNSLATWIDIWAHMVSDDRASVLSMSYGLPEFAFSKTVVNAMNLALEEAASQGQASFTSTGDHGAYDGHRDEFKKNRNYNKLITHFPATSPWVTAVGGTKWAIDPQGSVTESGWSEPGDQNNPPAGGGGGLSALNRRPWYQQGPGVDNQYSTGAREVPDVSALAGSPGYDIYSVDDRGENPGFYITTGTSAATPLWAAYDALLNQSLNARIGFLNPSLYLLGQKASTFQNSPFNDVTSGDNLYYPATANYDLATGWGSMDGAALHDDLSSAGPVVTRPVNFTISFFTAKGKSKGKWKVIHALKRGQVAYIVDRTRYYDVPTENSIGTRTYTISQGSYTLVNNISQITVQHSALGHTVQHSLRFIVPPNAPTGTYTITVKLSVGAEGWNNSATATINVK